MNYKTCLNSAAASRAPELVDDRLQERVMKEHSSIRACKQVFARQLLGALTVAVLAAAPAMPAETARVSYAYTNLVDTTQGLFSFTSMPAISNSGAVAYTALRATDAVGTVFRRQEGQITVIATKDPNGLSSFGETVIVNSSGLVGFRAKVDSTGDTIIATGAGGPLRQIASAAGQGLVGFVLGISGLNDSGRAAFLGFRRGFGSQAIFTGDGGALTPVVDTLTDARFVSLGNPGFNNSGAISFAGDTGFDLGIFTSVNGVTRAIATTGNDFVNFIDPVINNSGTLAGGAFFTAGGAAAFTSNGNGLSLSRGLGAPFLNVDNVSINQPGEIVFLGTDSAGRDGIYIKRKLDPDARLLMVTGDGLFGSTVTSLAVGRYCSNSRGQIVFRYTLADARSGLALGVPVHAR